MNNATISELNMKTKKMKQKQKVADAVEEAPNMMGPTPGKKFQGSSDEKFNRTGSADSQKKPKKGKGSDDNKGSSDSDRRGPIIPAR